MEIKKNKEEVKMFIKIISCSDEKYWYKDYVGKVFSPSFVDTPTGAQVIENIDGTGNIMGSVFPGDFEEVNDFFESELFLPPTPPKTKEELELENLKSELEITQNALNEILMVQLGGM